MTTARTTRGSLGAQARAGALDRLRSQEFDLIVIGGGVSKDHQKYLPKLKLNAPIVPAKHHNRAGIIGAAWLAVDRTNNPDPLRDSPAARPGTIN